MSVYLENPVNYRNIVKVGDKIRSWDFPVREGVEDRYVEGIVKEFNTLGLMDIEVTFDSVDWGDLGDRVGLTVSAPFYLNLDWADRIEVLENENV